MVAFKDWPRSLRTMNVLIIQLVVWLGWLSSIASGQLEVSEVVGGFVNFPEVGLSCIGNLAVLITALTKGRLDLEMGARDVLATIRGPKVEDIHGVGLTTCTTYEDASVVMLSNDKPNPNSSIVQFMKYISSACKVQSILLHSFPLKSSAPIAEISNCSDTCNQCRCVVICTVEEIKELLDRRIPRTVLKRVNETRCLLLSPDCLTNGCHGSNEDISKMENLLSPDCLTNGCHGSNEDISKMDNLGEGDFNEKLAPPAEILAYIQKNHTCICIPMFPNPMFPKRSDDWTKLLITLFKYKDNEDRGISVMASDAMESYISRHAMKTYMGRSGRLLKQGLIVEYSTLLDLAKDNRNIILLLIGWFRVDGFSTSMVARKAVKGYLVGSKGNVFAANAFLTGALVKSNDSDTNICQVLTFRGPLLRHRTFAFIAGGVNLFCSIFWAVFVAFEAGAGKWYDINSTPLSMGRIAVIITAIGISLGMDCLHVCLYLRSLGMDCLHVCLYLRRSDKLRKLSKLLVVIVLEITCIAYVTVVARSSGIKAFGTWVYSAMHGLVWLKWGIGSYLLGEHSKSNSEYEWESGVIVYASAFFLNFMLAGVRCTWKYSPT